MPAAFAVGLLSPFAGDVGESAASFSGGISLNATLPTQGGRAVVDAGNPVAAIQAALINTVTVIFAGQSAGYTPGATTVSTTTTAQVPFLVVPTASPGVYELRLEDLANMPGVPPDWDYNDRTWTVSVTELAVVSVTAATAGEDTPDGSAPAVFTLTRSATSADVLSGPLVVPFTLGGTSVPGVDYTPPSAFLAVFWPGQAVTKVVLPVVNDPTADPTKTVVITADPADGFVPGPTTTVGTTITDPGPVPPVPPAPTAEVWVSCSLDGEERADGLKPVVFQLSRTNPGNPATAPALTVSFTLSGVAIAGTDYAFPGSYTVAFAPGELTAVVVLRVLEDELNEGAESTILTLNSGGGYTITTGKESDWANIYDLGAMQTVWVTAAQDAAELGEQAGWFTVHRSSGAGSLVVNYATPIGTAVYEDDYTDPASAGGFVTFLDGQTTASVRVSPVDDLLEEGTETVVLSLTSGRGYAIRSPSSATIRIYDDDGPSSGSEVGVWMTADSDANEYGQQAGWFTVHRSRGVGMLSVYYAAPTGTAAVGSDYSGPSTSGGVVSFANGETEKRVYVTPVDDAVVEETETVDLKLLPGAGYTVGMSGPARVVIYDDEDTLGTISGVVWNDDQTPDNVRGPSDALMGGVSVSLFDSQGGFLRETLTNSAGEYTFDELPDGSFKVRIAATGFEPVAKDYGTDDTVDSDVNADGWGDPIFIAALTPGQQDGGVKKPADSPPADLNIKTITWVEIKDKGARLNPSDYNGFGKNPNAGGGDAVFPERRVNQANDKDKTVSKGPGTGDEIVSIQLHVQLTDKVGNVAVRVRLVDVDDPSANKVNVGVEGAMPDPTGVLDDTDLITANGNLESGDNRTPLDPAAALKVTTTDNNGLATFTFKLSGKPGDNYRAVVTIDPAKDLDMFAGKKNDGEAKAYVVPATGTNVGAAVPLGDGTNKVKTAMSKLLTVWRSLYIELDSMTETDKFGRDKPLMTPETLTSDELRSIYKKAYIRIDHARLLSHSTINKNSVVDLQLNIDLHTTKKNGEVIPGRMDGLGADPDLKTWVGKGKRDTNSSEDLWVVWVIAAAQPGKAELGLMGETVWTTTTNGQDTQNQRPIYLLKDRIIQVHASKPEKVGDNWNKVKDDVVVMQRVLAHEILHRFGGEHGTQGILSDEQGTPGKEYFYNYYSSRSFDMNLVELKLVRDSAKGVS